MHIPHLHNLLMSHNCKLYTLLEKLEHTYDSDIVSTSCSILSSTRIPLITLNYRLLKAWRRWLSVISHWHHVLGDFQTTHTSIIVNCLSTPIILGCDSPTKHVLFLTLGITL